MNSKAAAEKGMKEWNAVVAANTGASAQELRSVAERTTTYFDGYRYTASTNSDAALVLGVVESLPEEHWTTGEDCLRACVESARSGGLDYQVLAIEPGIRLGDAEFSRMRVRFLVPGTGDLWLEGEIYGAVRSGLALFLSVTWSDEVSEKHVRELLASIDSEMPAG
jgi:hypothetical protein